MTLKRKRAALLATCLVLILASIRAHGQSIKGSNTNQLSSSFSQIFNSLTPVQQQQFIRQMSSSNRRIFQQMLFAPQTNQFNSFDERFESSSIPTKTQGAKSAKFSLQQQSRGSLSPVQQAQFIRNQHLLQQQQQQSTAPIATDGSSSFSSEFFSSKSVPPPRQQSSYFNRVQEVKQVSSPVVVQPATEHSFRRVQSFSSQPLPVQQQQQFVQQRFFQEHSQERPVVPGSFNQFSSSSSSSNLAGGSGLFGSGAGFDGSGLSSASLQQEKLDSESLENSFGIQQQQQHENFDNVLDLGLEQQNNLLPDMNGGLMAASINNRWYIMKPIENPSAFGLKRVRIPESQIVDIARLRLGPARASGGASVAASLTTTSSSDAGTGNRRPSGKQEARTSAEEPAVAVNGATSSSSSSSTPLTTAGASISTASSGASFGVTRAPNRSSPPPGERIRMAEDDKGEIEEEEASETT